MPGREDRCGPAHPRGSPRGARPSTRTACAGSFTVRPGSGPDDLEALVLSSEHEGYRFLVRLRDDWRSGRNRFERTGERLVTARVADELVGIGGITIDPYARDIGVGRLRHLYVSAKARRRGIGRAIVRHLLDDARGRFESVRLRVADGEGGRFYERIGFAAVDEEAVSHAVRMASWPAP